jgi:hypothetical protein
MKKMIITIIGALALGVSANAGVFNVYVTFPSGSMYSGARVVGEVCGFTGGMTKAVYTDNKGYAMLKWDSDAPLCSICVNGTCSDGKYTSGAERAFTAK